MRHPLLCTLPALLGLVLGLTACQDRESFVQPTTSETQGAGKIAFRLSAAELSVVMLTSDSVKIEAVRDGFATQTATGSIAGGTLLTNLSPGKWTLKVAAFNTLQAIRWYGEEVVQVIAGTTVDAVVVLRKASGSVNVRILLDTLAPAADTMNWVETPSEGSLPGYLPILRAWRSDSGISILTSLYCVGVVVRQIPDSGTVLRFGMDLDMEHKCAAGTAGPVVVFVPWRNCGNVTLQDADGRDYALSGPDCWSPSPQVDTITVNWIEDTAVRNYKGIPLDHAWRDDKGIYIATQYDYVTPVVVHNLRQSSLPRRLYLAGIPIETFAAVKSLPHVIFVPFPRDEDVIIANLLNDSSIRLPGNPIVAIDSFFVTYVKAVKHPRTRAYDVITLSSNGEVVRQVHLGGGDSAAAEFKAILARDSLPVISKILERASTRNPEPLPDLQTLIACPADMPTNTRQTSYANGGMSTMSWSQSSYCGALPDSWRALDRVDAMLERLFNPE